MFKITAGKGFHVTFPNGLTVSVQWGYGNYCDNRDHEGARVRHDYMTMQAEMGALGSETAEVLVFDRTGASIKVPTVLGGVDYDDVNGYVDAAGVALILAWAAAQKP